MHSREIIMIKVSIFFFQIIINKNLIGASKFVIERQFSVSLKFVVYEIANHVGCLKRFNKDTT